MNSKHAITFTVDELADGVFAVRPAAALNAGEYAFALRMGETA